MKKKHGNSHENMNTHHLYAFDDRKNDDIFKYGISDDPIDGDGLSDRMRKQLDLYNLIAGFTRFVGRILMTGIKGRKRAEEIETKYINDYFEEHGKYPIGNRKKGRRKK